MQLGEGIVRAVKAAGVEGGWQLRWGTSNKLEPWRAGHVYLRKHAADPAAGFEDPRYEVVEELAGAERRTTVAASLEAALAYLWDSGYPGAVNWVSGWSGPWTCAWWHLEEPRVDDPLHGVDYPAPAAKRGRKTGAGAS